MRSASLTIIPPKTSKLISVTAPFTEKNSELFIKQIFTSNKNSEDIFAAAHTLISQASPNLHVANFSKEPVVISSGQILGIGHNPRTWLTRCNEIPPETLQRMEVHASLIRQTTVTVRSLTDNLVTSRGKSTIEDPAFMEGAEGGPKTAEAPPEEIKENDLIKAVNFSEHLSEDQQIQLQQTVAKHKLVFSLNGRLGHYNAKVKILLKTDVQLVSLPPFPALPANCQVMYKQMNM